MLLVSENVTAQLDYGERSSRSAGEKLGWGN